MMMSKSVFGVMDGNGVDSKLYNSILSRKGRKGMLAKIAKVDS
jgi:hypothetical protein